ncbi:MAG TPA: hypothetical protein VG983_09620 [Caulobacterales bacterium]|nr:hypothetical protein [Caulobacterales bacterium]
MLAYLDKAPLELDRPARLCLAALRLWSLAMRDRRCPINELRDLFTRVDAHGAIWPAHNLFWCVAFHARRPLHLGCPCCGRVSDDEATLLTAILADGAAQSEIALADLIESAGKTQARRFAAALAAELRKTN